MTSRYRTANMPTPPSIIAPFVNDHLEMGMAYASNRVGTSFTVVASMRRGPTGYRGTSIRCVPFARRLEGIRREWKISTIAASRRHRGGSSDGAVSCRVLAVTNKFRRFLSCRYYYLLPSLGQALVNPWLSFSRNLMYHSIVSPNQSVFVFVQ